MKRYAGYVSDVEVEHSVANAGVSPAATMRSGGKNTLKRKEVSISLAILLKMFFKTAD